MIITNKTLPRRTFLRGVGAAVALPVLDSMFPAMAVSAQGRRLVNKAPIRLGYVYTPNGIIGCSEKSPRQNLWTPKTVGANFDFVPTIKSLEPYRQDVNVFSGLAQVTNSPMSMNPPIAVTIPRARLLSLRT